MCDKLNVVSGLKKSWSAPGLHAWTSVVTASKALIPTCSRLLPLMTMRLPDSMLKIFGSRLAMSMMRGSPAPAVLERAKPLGSFVSRKRACWARGSSTFNDPFAMVSEKGGKVSDMITALECILDARGT